MTSHHIARVLGLALAVSLPLAEACGLASFLDAEVRTFRSESAQEIGELRWEILDCKTGSTLSRATRTILARDVIITRTTDAAGEVMFDKRIDLDKGFYVELVETSEQTPGKLSGFALNAGRDGSRTFCWDWFSVEGTSRAMKIQESGELDFSQIAAGSHWVIGHTDVTSAVSLRVFLFDLSGVNHDAPDWRVQLEKGSRVAWPSVVDGIVVLPLGSTARPN